MSINEPVTAEDIFAFIREFNLDSKCLTCGNDKWSLEGADLNGGVQIVITKNTNSEKSSIIESGITAYALLCTTCGYAKVYGKYAVKQWKENKDKK